MLNRNFNLLWLSQIVSSIGNKLTIFGFPLVGIFIYDTTVLETSMITVMSFLPSLLFGTIIGVVVDRGDKRKIGIFTNIICFVISIILFVFSIFKILPLWGFYILIFLLNTFLLFGSISFYSQIPMVVEKENLKKANYKMELSNSVIDTAAPSVGGIIFGLFSAPFIFIIDGITFILASFCQILLPCDIEKDRVKTKKKSIVHIREAYNYVFNNQILFKLAMSYFVLVFGIGIFQSIQFYYLSKVLNVAPYTIGMIISVGNIGLVVASISSLKISDTIGMGRTIILSFILYAVGFTLYYLSSEESTLSLFVATMCIGAAMPLYNVNATTIRQSNVDLSMLGSVSAIWRIFGRGLIPLGATIGGGISTYFSVGIAILISVIIVLLGLCIVLFSDELKKYT